MERIARKSKREENMKLKDIKKIAVVGAGVMGVGIAQNFAQAGFEVSLYDIKEKALENATLLIKANLETFVKNDIITKEKAQDTLPRIKTTTNMTEAVEDAYFITESIFEVMDEKKDIFRKLEKLCPNDAILASNSSTLPISEIAKATNRPERVILTHYLNPPHVIPVVEIVKGDKTSEETINITREMMIKIGKTPVVLVKTIPGYLVNSFNSVILGTALELMEDGVSSKEEIDALFKYALGPRLSVLGPFEILDIFGLDLARTAARGMVSMGVKRWEPVLNSVTLKELVETGNFGLKTGRGYYDYTEKPYEKMMNVINERLFVRFIDVLRERLFKS